MTEDLIGRVAVSRAGHDKGRAFVITGAEGEYLLLADGRARKLTKPKRKKRMHVFLRPETAGEIRRALTEGLPLTDREVEKALSALGYHHQNEQEGYIV